MKGIGGWLLVVGCARAIVACETQELTVFEVPAAGVGGTASASAGAGGGGAGGGGAGSGGMSGAGGLPAGACESHADCMPDGLCEKPGCQASFGVCRLPAQVFCPHEPEPVCGCNGVTYWNDCVRRQYGVQVKAAGECPVDSAARCNDGSDCIPGAFCAHLRQGGSTCGEPGRGSCWVIHQCPPPNSVDDDEPVWQDCVPPHSDPPRCVPACWAIHSERRHIRRTREACSGG